jgi:D-alanyl-D-alanine carboxypeptidase
MKQKKLTISKKVNKYLFIYFFVVGFFLLVVLVRPLLAKDYSTRIPLPDRNSINQGLISPTPSYMKSVLGIPGQLTIDCSPVTNTNLKKLIVVKSVGPFRVTGLKPAVSAIQRIFEKVKAEKPELYKQVGTAGMLCVRKIRGGLGFSNHSWGTTIDITINGKLEPLGSNRAQLGLKDLYPYFHSEKFYWGAGFSPRSDSMHFEASQQLIALWKKSGEVP